MFINKHGDNRDSYLYNPVLSRSFQVTVKTKLDNYLGNLSNTVIMEKKVAPIHWETEQGWLHRWVAAGWGNRRAPH